MNCKPTTCLAHLFPGHVQYVLDDAEGATDGHRSIPMYLETRRKSCRSVSNRDEKERGDKDLEQSGRDRRPGLCIGCALISADDGPTCKRRHKSLTFSEHPYPKYHRTLHQIRKSRIPSPGTPVRVFSTFFRVEGDRSRRNPGSARHSCRGETGGAGRRTAAAFPARISAWPERGCPMARDRIPHRLIRRPVARITWACSVSSSIRSNISTRCFPGSRP